MEYNFKNLLWREDLIIDSERLVEQQAADTTPTESMKSELLSNLSTSTDDSCTKLYADVSNIRVSKNAALSGHAETQRQSPDQYKTASRATIGPGHKEEPFRLFSPIDRVGLALSGGGIRSATFNLGLLKGLNDLKLLRHFDYVSSVSGGGYIASWWTAWRSRPNSVASVRYPVAGATDGCPNPEPAEVLHLRKFSNFLVPRIGFFEVDFWNGVLAVLSSLLPSLLIANSLLVAAIWCWLFLSWPLLGLPSGIAIGVLVALTAVVQLAMEWWWHKPKIPNRFCFARDFWIAAVFTFVVLTGLCLALHHWPPKILATALPQPPITSEDFFPYVLLDKSVALRLFCPVAIWLATAAIVILVRAVGYGVRQVLQTRGLADQRTSTLELAARRVLDRLVGMAVVWAIATTIWLVALRFSDSLTYIISTGTTSAVLFAMLRKWLPVALRPAKQVGFAKSLLPLIPQLLAYLVIVLALIAICILIQFSFKSPIQMWGLPIVALLILDLGYCLFDPVNVGIHAFYRDRLCRAYLGASNPRTENDQSTSAATDHSQGDKRETEKENKDLSKLVDTQPDDDLRVSEVRRRPFHLICCAANELDYDPLANFARGARSAVVSRLGLSIGDRWAECPDLMVSSAVTASAAAFNPAMGSVSMQLGPAVGFLMCALGLRLGLWIDRPDKAADGKLRCWRPGLFFHELLSSSDEQLVQLSDGGHFENLGLYELVRRHCRYIVVSDCGADPTVAFDDLANATRRIREDFGVEIEINVAPLKPGTDGFARQHMVVGTIHYDRLCPEKNDKGILLLFKPNLTGDEPSDVQQYATRNSAFPNESTADQFYDEAQWESYRRLGEHAARGALRFVEQLESQSISSGELFAQARNEWYPTPLDLTDNFEALTARFVKLEEKMRTAPATFVEEVYPELGTISPREAAPMSPAEMQSVLSLLVEMIQLMEDVYLQCHLEETRDHPLNTGWMNLFARWSNGNTFQLWWPFLKSLYSFRFTAFIEREFSLGSVYSLKLVGPLDKLPEGLATKWWRRANPAFEWQSDNIACDYRLSCQSDDSSKSPIDWQVALLVAQRIEHNGQATAFWKSSDLYVPPSLWRSGFGTSFLAALLILFKGQHFTRCQVEITKDEKRTDPSSRSARTDTIAFYKWAGFLETEDGQLILDLSDNKPPQTRARGDQPE